MIYGISIENERYVISCDKDTLVLLEQSLRYLVQNATTERHIGQLELPSTTEDRTWYASSDFVLHYNVINKVLKDEEDNK